MGQFLPNINSDDQERSAKFFVDIINHFGAENFYKSFYVTNISWVGFVKDNKNLNYYDLPMKAKKFVYDSFEFEMSIIKPKKIICLGKEVQATAKELFNDKIDSDTLLAHPNYCAFPSNYDEQKKKYLETLKKYVDKN